MSPAPPRLLLVDLLPDAAVHNPRTIAFPFLTGLCRLLGWRGYWRVLGVPHSGDQLYALAPRDLGLLLAEAKRLAPRVVAINQRLPADQLRALRKAAPGARVVYWDLTENVQDLARTVRRLIPGLRGPALADPRLLDRIRPDYRRKILNGAAWAADPVIEVIGGHRCAYRSPAARNPFYAGLPLPAKTMGCSFCRLPDPATIARNVADPVEFALRQIEAARRRRPAAGAEPRFDLCGFELWRRFEELAAELIRRGVRGVELRFMPRLDELLRAREALERRMPELAGAGIAVRLYGLGVENFSPDENMRLHKGLSAEQVHEAAAFMLEAAARWPGRFRPPSGGLGMILFTPWTRLEDLRVNLDHIERCPLIDGAFALGRRLMLFPGAAASLLAEKDGLLAKAGEGVFYNAGCKHDAELDELPWRFARPEIGPLWSLARRISSDRFNVPDGDPDKRAVEAFVKESSSEPARPLPLFRRAVEAVERRPETRTVPELLALLRVP